MNGARSFTGEQKENKKSSGAKQMRPEPAIRAASFVDPSRLPARRFKRSGTTVAVRQRSNCLRSATFTVTVAELWFENHNSATSATANGPPNSIGRGHGGGRNARATSTTLTRVSNFPQQFTLENRRSAAGSAANLVRHALEGPTYSVTPLCGTTMRVATEKHFALVQKLWTIRLRCGSLRKNAQIHQTLEIFEGQELEIMERASRSQDGAPLVYEHERSSGGLMKRHEERFPSAIHQNRKCGLKCRGSCCLTPVVGICFSATTTRKPKRWSSTATTVFGDANGNVSRQGCAIATGTRY